MGTLDRTLRATAFPYQGQVFGYNRIEGSDYNISNAKSLGDLAGLANNGSGTPAKDNLIRIMRPQYGTLVAAYLYVALTTGSTEPTPRFQVSVSYVTSTTDLTAVTPTQAQIDACMVKLTGATTAYTNTAGQPITVKQLNLMPALPGPSDSTFRNDCFVVGIHFPQTPVASGFSLAQFRVEMSSIMAAVQ